MPEPTPDAVAALAEALYETQVGIFGAWSEIGAENQRHYVDDATDYLAALPEGWSLTTTPDPDARLVAALEREHNVHKMLVGVPMSPGFCSAERLLNEIQGSGAALSGSVLAHGSPAEAPVLANSQPAADAIAEELALGKAWKAAEAALPEGWMFSGLQPSEDGWAAYADTRRYIGGTSRRGTGSTPAEALNALARVLATTPTEGKARQLADFIGVAPNLLYDAPTEGEAES